MAAQKMQGPVTYGLNVCLLAVKYDGIKVRINSSLEIHDEEQRGITVKTSPVVEIREDGASPVVGDLASREQFWLASGRDASHLGDIAMEKVWWRSGHALCRELPSQLPVIQPQYVAPVKHKTASDHHPEGPKHLRQEESSHSLSLYLCN